MKEACDMEFSFRRYLALTKAGIIQSLNFRLGMFVTVLGNLIYLLLVYFLWKAIYASSATDVVNGMTFSDTFIYLVLASALFSFMEMYIVWNMSREIQSGKIILDLLKPMEYRGFKFWSYSGDLVVYFFLTFLPTFLIVFIVTKGAIPVGMNLIWFVVSVVLALTINFNIDMFVATICLYTESTWGINIMKESVVLLLSGATIPLAFFPDKIAAVVRYLPFRAVYDVPLNILLGKTSGSSETLMLIGLQLFWAVVLAAVSSVFWKYSVRRITVNGG